MAKKVFNNISNFQLVVGDDNRLGLKRTSQDANQCPVVTKKSKPETSNGVGKARSSRNQENQVKCESVTKTIERKVKSISLDRPRSSGYQKAGNNSKKKSTEADLISDDEEIKVAPKRLTCRLPVELKGRQVRFDDPLSYYVPPPGLPSDIKDCDLDTIEDIFAEPHYAFDIFKFYKTKEEVYATIKYIHNQPEVSRNMRAVLVDWLVEVQQNYSLNHETLYLSVKIIDRYLMRKSIEKSKFQLLGATALLIAAKFDERIPPAIDDFVYSCDNLYTKHDVILMEIEVLKTLDFYIGFPLSYRFLRRYARADDRTQTELYLARYILETSLMEHDLMAERESRISAAALLLAIRMVNRPEANVWTKRLEFYSGYSEDELLNLVRQLNEMISDNIRFRAQSAVKSKYSHRVFLEVAKISPLPR